MKIIDIKIKRISFDEYVFKVRNKKGKILCINDKYYLVDKNNKRISGMFNDIHSCIYKFIKKEKLILN